MLHSLKAAIAARLARFARQRDGNIALIFGLCAIPVIVGAGVAIDAARAYMIKLELESALDSAVLAVASSPGLSAAQLQARMTSYFNANYEGTPISQNLSVSMTDPTQPVITVTATVNVPTTFLELVNIPNVAVAASSQVTKGTNALELALVLDNTGSMMCGDGGGCSTPSHISTLKTDGKTIVDTLFADSVDPTKLKISIVPYVTAVNIGPAMSQTGILATNVLSVSGVYKDYKGNPIKDPTNANIVYDPTQTSTATNAWKGCVVEPTLPAEDGSGNGPDISEPAGGWTGATMGSFWTPYYWKSGTATSYNGFNGSGSDNTWYISTKTPKQKIQYQEIDGNVSSATTNSYGPNLSCPTPLVRLTNTQATLDSAMQNMTSWANSGTAITVGMIWGWRTLSPNPPFSDGQPYGTPSLIKAVVLETDGDAEVAGNTQSNTLDYTGYGYISDGKLGSSTSGQYLPYGTPAVGTANYYLQQRLTTLCTNMKNAGIVIFTVGLGDGATNQQLKNCAGPTGKGMFYAAPTAASLTTAFQQIAVALNSLRLSK
jgi:Flp pilus assembly protein TadG